MALELLPPSVATLKPEPSYVTSLEPERPPALAWSRSALRRWPGAGAPSGAGLEPERPPSPAWSRPPSVALEPLPPSVTSLKPLQSSVATLKPEPSYVTSLEPERPPALAWSRSALRRQPGAVLRRWRWSCCRPPSPP
ncbi:hypothetical protein [Azospirillum oleiclasticum]|uniref:Uncharacterized protein n=1 Tax=Azospirillum oleiclasticum TaxID=2735135 RepID=A0ABX2T4Y5_9PROT|nr:hypothetical protein [Azospirillum oleiclasticum]NYZ18352.1 hypothetical protein [Azospirillum oleiclasticum]